MAKTVEIKIPRNLKPEFPRRCIRCGYADCVPRFRVAGYTSSWRRFFFWWWVGRKYTVYVPACDHCKPILTRRRFIRNAMPWVLVVAAIFGLGDLFQRIGWPVSRLNVILGVIVILLVYELVLMAYPAIIDITVYKDEVAYEFRDPRYARDFIYVNSQTSGQ